MVIDPAISLATALSIAALLAAAAVHKAAAFREFVATVQNYQLIFPTAAPIFAAVLIAAELSIAGAMVAPTTRAVAAFGAAAIFTLYGAAIATNILRGRSEIDCGCSFGAASDRLTPTLVLRNTLLAVASIAAGAPIATRSLGMFDFAFVGLSVVAASSLYLAFEALRSNTVRFQAMESVR